MTRSSSRAALAAVALLAAVVIATHSPARVAQPADPALPDLAAEAPPERYAAWAPFVVTWTVDGSSGTVASAAEHGFGADPCGPLGVRRCHVRLAWHDVSRWSLAASVDAGDGFTPSALQLSTGGLHYAVDRGVVVSVVDTDRLPGLHLCHRLAEARAAGDAVATRPVEGLARGAWTLSLGDLEVECSGSAGIPVRIAAAGVTWEPSAVEQRMPTPAEIGEALVAGRAEVCLPPRCGDAGLAAEMEALAEAAGFRVASRGAALEVVVPWAQRDRAATAWATQGRDLPDGMRRHRVAEGFVIEESLRPVTVVTWQGPQMRVWLAFAGGPRPGSVERDAFVLGEALRRIVGGPPGPVFAPVSGAASR